MAMGWWLAVGIVSVVVLSSGAAGVANHPPLADAGLDQTVEVNTTVFLDAGGSVDPDGSLTTVTWAITTANGRNVNATCLNCTQTQFTPARTGNYTATVTLTDDDGASRTDTLFVTVVEPRGPTVDLSGPTRITTGKMATFTVSATDDEAALDRLIWRRNDSHKATVDVNPNSTAMTVNRSFDSPGTYRVQATVSDMLGYRGSASQTIVVARSGGGGGGGRYPDPCADERGNAWYVDGDFQGCANGADYIFGFQGTQYVLHKNDRPGLWLYDDYGNLVQMATPEEEDKLAEPNEPVTADALTKHYREDIKNPFRTSYRDNPSDSSEENHDPSPSRDYDHDGDKDNSAHFPGSHCSDPWKIYLPRCSP